MRNMIRSWRRGLAVGAGVATMVWAMQPAIGFAQISYDAPSAALTASMVELDSAWQASPLGFTDARFVENPASGYGAFQPKEGATFASDETINVYVEPVGYSYRTEGKTHRVELAVDFEILNQTGQVLAEQNDFARVTASARNRLREFQASLSFRFEGLTDGDYVLAIRFRDANSEKAGEIRLPFRVESPAQ